MINIPLQHGTTSSITESGGGGFASAGPVTVTACIQHIKNFICDQLH